MNGKFAIKQAIILAVMALLVHFFVPPLLSLFPIFLIFYALGWGVYFILTAQD